MRTTKPRLLRDVAWSAIGIGGAFGAVRVMEAFRPEVISDDVSAPENDASVRELGRAYVLSACAMAAGPFATSARLPGVCGPLGLGVEVAAVGLRAWSMRSLRGHYARGLRVVEGQPVVRSGPYGVVRHPGYLSAYLAWLGAATSTRNAVPVALTLVAVGTAYRHRMDAEDALLIRDLPGYAEYAETTGRLVPSLGTITGRLAATVARTRRDAGSLAPAGAPTAAGNAVVGSVSTTHGVAVAGSVATADSVAVAGSVATAGSVAVAGSVATAGSVAVGGSAATFGSVGILMSALSVFGVGLQRCLGTLACVNCTQCLGCIACVDCVDCVGCIGCVGLRGAVGQRGVRA